MLVIRDAQLQELAGHAESRFEQRMTARLFEYFPQQCGFLGRALVTDAVRLGLAQAGARGYQSELAQSYYLTLMFMLGSEFETDPQLPFLAAVLDSHAAADPAARLTACYDAAMTFLDTVCGDENEHLVRALVRIRDFDLLSFDVADSARGVDAIAARLTALYPEKAAAIGDFAMRDLAAAGDALAPTLGCEGPRGAMLCAGLAFMLGSGFHRDPQFPWVATALATGERRVEALHAAALAFLQVGLS